MTRSVCYVLFAETFHTRVISCLFPMCLSQSQPVRVFAVAKYHLRYRVRSADSPHVGKLLLYQTAVAVVAGVPGDLDSIHLTTPPSRRGRGKQNPPIFYFVHVFVTIVPMKHVILKENNVTSHHTAGTTYYTWDCSGLQDCIAL